jgi:hypothetical protein
VVREVLIPVRLRRAALEKREILFYLEQALGHLSEAQVFLRAKHGFWPFCAHSGFGACLAPSKAIPLSYG